MEKLVLEVLAKIAYESYCNSFEGGNGYFGIPESPEWKWLPEYSKEHWRKVTKAVYYASINMDIDVGDLE